MKRVGSAENVRIRESDPFHIKHTPTIEAYDEEPDKKNFRVLVLGEGGKQGIVSNPGSKDLKPIQPNSFDTAKPS